MLRRKDKEEEKLVIRLLLEAQKSPNKINMGGH